MVWLYGVIVFLLIIAVFLLIAFSYMSSIKKKELLYDIDASIKITVKKDITYKNADGKSLLMDLYRPEDAGHKEKLPAVILIHGEGPEIFIKDAKDWGVYTSYGKLLSSMGFAAVTFNHRRAASDFTKINEVARDVLDAVKYVKNNAESLNIDINRICVWTFSLGGIYTGLFLKNTEEKVKCLISYYGFLDIYAKVSRQGDIYDAFTPKNYLSKLNSNVPSIFIVKAAQDKIKGVNQSIDEFIQQAKLNNIKYNYIIHKTGGHAFDAMNDNSETRDIIGQTLKFIENNL